MRTHSTAFHMKKTAAILLITLICCAMFTGCGKIPPKDQEQHPTVYSFSGENEQFTISNGVIVLTPTEVIFCGGDLKEKQEKLSDIAAYSTTFYISGDEKKILLSNRVEDMTGGTVTIAGETGKASGDIITGAKIDELKSNLYFELKTTNLNGEKNKYQLQLNLTEVTGKADS